jgi:hypothetical protein
MVVFQSTGGKGEWILNGHLPSQRHDRRCLDWGHLDRLTNGELLSFNYVVLLYCFINLSFFR